LVKIFLIPSPAKSCYSFGSNIHFRNLVSGADYVFVILSGLPCR